MNDIMSLFVNNNCWTRLFSLGYLLHYLSSVFGSDKEKNFTGKIFSQVSLHVAFVPLSIFGTVSFVTIGSCIILNRLVVGSNMVRHMKLILVSSLPLRVY